MFRPDFGRFSEICLKSSDFNVLHLIFMVDLREIWRILAFASNSSDARAISLQQITGNPHWLQHEKRSLPKQRSSHGRVCVYSPYLLLNFSTRPPRWVNFCCPVKNGWQAEQISVLISSSVDLVTKVLPHAQVTLHSLNSGWIPCFMLSPHF